MKYFVFADIEYNGFVIGSYQSLKEAEVIMNKTWDFGSPPSDLSLTEICEVFRHLKFREYNLTEENFFENRSIKAQSNGFFTVGIVESNMDITTESFIKTRQIN